MVVSLLSAIPAPTCHRRATSAVRSADDDIAAIRVRAPIGVDADSADAEHALFSITSLRAAVGVDPFAVDLADRVVANDRRVLIRHLSKRPRHAVLAVTDAGDRREVVFSTRPLRFQEMDAGAVGIGTDGADDLGFVDVCDADTSAFGVLDAEVLDPTRGDTSRADVTP